MSLIKNNSIFQYIAVLLIIAMSGAHVILGLYVPINLLLIMFLAYSFFFYKHQKGKINKWPLISLIVIVLWIIIEQKIINIAYDNYYYQYIIFYVGTFLIVSAISFDDFVRKLLSCIKWLSLISIIINELYWAELIAGKYYANVLSSGITVSAYIFNMGWGSQNRLASIFWEPGQYQIILNFTLILCSNDIIDLFKEHRYMILIKKYIILIVALMLTKSTAGYIAFGIICIYVMFNVLDKRKIGQAIIVTAFCVTCVSVLLSSDALQEKFAQKNETTDTSYSIRMMDNLGLLRMIQERPIVGYGIQTKSFQRRAYAIDNRTSSNGWLNAGAQLGLPFLIFLLFSVWHGLKNMFRDRKMICICFVVVIVAQANEAAYALPFLSLFLFRFKAMKEKQHAYLNR